MDTTNYYSGDAILVTANTNNRLPTENILGLSCNIIASARFDDRNPNTTDPYADKYFFYHYEAEHREPSEATEKVNFFTFCILYIGIA